MWIYKTLIYKNKINTEEFLVDYTLLGITIKIKFILEINICLIEIICKPSY